MNKVTRVSAGILAAVLLFSIFLTGGCASKNEGFAIYLTKDNIPPSQMEMLSHVEPADEPVIFVDDIVSYDAVTHEIELTEDGFNSVAGQAVPTSGTSFLVCLNKSPIYWGAFWAMYSSQSFDGVTIWMPLGAEGNTIQIQAGYPAAGFYSGKDPRNNPDIMMSLKKSGKLINELPTTFIDMLPQSMKGYELYSWQTDGEWHFRLIMGTNRNKTLEEILEGEDIIEGWVSVHVVGIDALASVLSKVPEGEEVIWLDNGFPGIEDTGESLFVLPDEGEVTRIQHYAEMCGFKLTVFPEQQ